MKNLNLKREFSAGGAVYRRRKVQGARCKVVFLVGKHSGYHKWVLPKGLIETGEEPWQTAIRETEEEMGVKSRLVDEKPIHMEKYVYWADLKKSKRQKAKGKTADKNSKVNKSARRVERYQEEGGGKTKVIKSVIFYLLEHVSGDPKDHGWEMENAGWFACEKALELMGFEGEKEALRKAFALLQD